MQLDKTFAKCMMCIKDGSTVEKNVFAFRPYGICLCEKHLWEIVKDKLLDDNAKTIIGAESEE